MLALLAGLTAGVAMAMVAAGRRTATAYDRFSAYADVPELLVNFCPPGARRDRRGVDPAVLHLRRGDERDVIAALPEVEAASPGLVPRPHAGAARRPDDSWMASTLVATQDPGITSAAGRFQIVEGRAADR